MEFTFNKHQTELTDELLNSIPEEVREQLFEIIQTVPFIQHLISKDRKYARDLTRDEKGRIIVDVAHPHILEDMDYFRQPALHYIEHGCYTFLRPNSNPNSEYRKFWDEEIRRMYEGYVRKSDGEWVTGYMYWFLNYNPMMVNFYKEGSKKAVRKESFPLVFEGIYFRFHYLWQAREKGHHGIELAKRGCGKSYSLSSIMTHNLILGESKETNRRAITILTAYQKEYLSDSKDGTLSKFKPSLNFIFDNTPLPHLLLKNSPNEMTWQMGYKDDMGREQGSLNQVMAVSAKDDSEKLRGKRGYILFEEMGSFKGLLSLYDITRRSVEDGDFTFAFMYLVGTSAEDESDFTSAKTLLYNPNGYNLQEVENVYDKINQGKKTFGYFFPAYVNRAGCYNKDGVSDVIKALIEVLINRYKMKYSSDPTSVLRTIAEDPITPAEAIIKVKNAYFPTTALTERLSQLDANPNAFDDVYTGNFNLKNGEVEFEITGDIPIRQYGVKNTTKGAVEIFEMPAKDKDGRVYYDRYIIGHDPVDNDQAESSSLSSTIVLDLWTDRIVAEYTGRQLFADENYEIVRMLCLFYNAKCMYECNKKGLYQYFQKMYSTHLLLETPQYLRDRQLVKYNNFGNNQYGVNASAAINNYSNSLIRDWLLLPKLTIIKKDDGTEIETTVPNLYNIKNRALLEELIAFAPEINVDRVRALGMVMLAREEKMVLWGGTVKKSEYKANTMTEDPFFKDNYDDKFDKGELKSVNGTYDF